MAQQTGEHGSRESKGSVKLIRCTDYIYFEGTPKIPISPVGTVDFVASCAVRRTGAVRTISSGVSRATGLLKYTAERYTNTA